MTIPAVPDQWAIRVESGSGKLIIVARNGPHDHWRDVAEAAQGESLVELIVQTMNNRTRG